MDFGDVSTLNGGDAFKMAFVSFICVATVVVGIEVMVVAVAVEAAVVVDVALDVSGAFVIAVAFVVADVVEIIFVVEIGLVVVVVDSIPVELNGVDVIAGGL